VYRAKILLVLLLLVACGAPAATPAPTSPAPAPTTAAEAAPSPAPQPTALSPEDALLATIAAGTTPTAIPDSTQPTPFPTITLGPTAEPQPLTAGWWDNAVCYEIFVRSFYDSDGDGIGDFKGLTAKLDYVNDGDPATTSDLGATCIWLMPVAEAESYHGYDTTDYYNVEKDYGTNADFKEFIAAAEQRGIKVIVDLVLNHVSSNHPWFVEALANPESAYRDWFIFSPTNPGYSGPWGDVAWHAAPSGKEYYYGVFWAGMPDLDYRNPEVIAESEKISTFWLEEMGVAGFRLDAIKHIVENGREQENTRETYAFLRQYQSFLRTMKPDVFTVGEIFGGRPGNLDGYYPDQLDTYFEFGIGEGILSAARSGSGNDFLRPATSAYRNLPFQRYAPFLTNHDQERAMSTLGGDIGRARVAAIALLTMPGIPFVYYGEELGMLGEKPDERLRTPMQWENAANAGFTTGTPWEGVQSDISTANVASQAADPNSLLNLYRTLIQLHTSTPALATGSFTALDTETKAAAFVRRSGDSAVLVLINMDTDPIEAASFAVTRSDLAPGTYQLEALLGEGEAATLTVGENGAISGYTALPILAPQSGYIFRLIPAP
jgi:alpha-amylase